MFPEEEKKKEEQFFGKVSLFICQVDGTDEEINLKVNPLFSISSPKIPYFYG